MKVINTSTAQNVFPENAKTASAIPQEAVNPTRMKCQILDQ